MKVFICIFLIITTVYAHGGSYGGGEHGGGGYGSGTSGHGVGGYGGGEEGVGGYGGGRDEGGGYGVGHGGGGSGGYGGVHGGYGGGHGGYGGGHGGYGSGYSNIGSHHHDFGHNGNDQFEIGHGHNSQEQVEIGQEEVDSHAHSGSGYQRVVTGSTYNQKPGRKVVVIETSRQFVSKPTHTVSTGSSTHQIGETALTEIKSEHGKDEQTDIGFGNGQEELVEIGQEELHSGSGYHQVAAGSTYMRKPGGRVVVIETTRQFGSNPTQTDNNGNSSHQTGETLSSEGSIKHGKDEEIETGQEQVEIDQEEQSGLLHSGSGNQRVITSSTYNQKPGGKFVVIETTRQFSSNPTQKTEITRHHTSETFSTGGINSLGKDDKSEFGFGKGQQEQIEIGQEEESDLLHSGSGNQKVITSSTYNQKPGETTRQLGSKPTQTVLTGGNGKDEQQEQVEIGQEQELEVENQHGHSQSGYHTLVTDTTSSHKQNGQVVIESTREVESKPTLYKSVGKHTSQGNLKDVNDEFKQSLSKPDDKVVGYVQITREFSSKPTEAVSHEENSKTVTKETTSYGKSQKQQIHNTKG